MNRALLLSAACALGCAHRASPSPGPATAAAAASADVLAPEQVVRTGLFAPESVAPGGHGELRIAIAIANGYHVMSDRPSYPRYIATEVAWQPRPGIAWQAPIYPAPETFRLGEEAIATFEGAFEVRVPFDVASDAPPGELELGGVLSYQACTRGSCLFPVKRPLSARIRIAP